MYTFLSGLIGALTAVMIELNGGLAKDIGNYASSIFIHLTGLILVALILLLSRSKPPFQKTVSPILLSGGALGFLTVVCANVGFMSLGVSLTLALGLLGQTVAALVIDHFGWLGAPVVTFDRRKIGSLALIACGIAVMAYF
jgi:bacterial/archaeal transporter family-2 protein